MDSITALRSAILDGPDPTEKGCPMCGLVTCQAERVSARAELLRLREAWLESLKRATDMDETIAIRAKLTAAEHRQATVDFECLSRPAVDWRAQLAKLREVAR